MAGIDGSQFGRYVNGERLPNDEGIVERIAVGLGMTMEETGILRNRYHRCLMGEQKFAWFQTIRRIEENEKVDFLTKRIQEQEMTNKIRELCSSSKKLYCYLTTDVYDYYESIAQGARDNSECELEMIFTLRNICNQDDISDIRCFQNAYCIMEKAKKCFIYEYYSDAESSVADNYILTDNGVLMFSLLGTDVQKVTGLYIEKEEMRRYFESKYLNQKERCYLYGYNEPEIDEKDVNSDAAKPDRSTGHMGKAEYTEIKEDKIGKKIKIRKGEKVIVLEENTVIEFFELYFKEQNSHDRVG